jgi:C-terminal associated domain of TOPRIM
MELQGLQGLQFVTYSLSSSKLTDPVTQGLGTSKDSDTRDDFSHMVMHMIPFSLTQNGHSELIDLAFSKKADDRKEWLRHFRVRPRPLLWRLSTYIDCAARLLSQS